MVWHRISISKSRWPMEYCGISWNIVEPQNFDMTWYDQSPSLFPRVCVETVRWTDRRERRWRKLPTFSVASGHWTPRMLGPHTRTSPDLLSFVLADIEACSSKRSKDTWVGSIRKLIIIGHPWSLLGIDGPGQKVGNDAAWSFVPEINWSLSWNKERSSQRRYAYCLNMSFEFDCTAEILRLKLSLSWSIQCFNELQIWFVLHLGVELRKIVLNADLQWQALLPCCQQMPRSLQHRSRVGFLNQQVHEYKIEKQRLHAVC